MPFMKTYAFLLLAVLMTIPAYGQKKGKVDPKDVTIDSLIMVNKGLTGQLDSAAMDLDATLIDLAIYKGVYTVFKDKVVKEDFDPANTGMIIDTLMAAREAEVAELNAQIKSLRDSVTVLQTDNVRLQAALDQMVAGTTNKDEIIEELKQLKELLDAKIITQDEYDSKKVKLLEKW
jgi:hypothetical protein